MTVIERTEVGLGQQIDVSREDIIEVEPSTRHTVMVYYYVNNCGVNGCKREVDSVEDVCWQHEGE